MIRNNTVSSIDSVSIFIAEPSLICSKSSDCLDSFENRGKYIRVIVGSLVLYYGHKTLKTHTSVNVFRRQSLESTIMFTVELDKNVVPDFQNVRVILVDELGGISSSDTVKMNFTDKKL